jgi:hypothetical protein
VAGDNAKPEKYQEQGGHRSAASLLGYIRHLVSPVAVHIKTSGSMGRSFEGFCEYRAGEVGSVPYGSQTSGRDRPDAKLEGSLI